MRTATLAVLTAAIALAACQKKEPADAPVAAAPAAAPAEPAPKPGAIPVNADNFGRAETDLAFANSVKTGGVGKLAHNRELTPLDKQLVVRQNRDTLYSSGVFDLDAGPVTITLPEAGGRFLSMQVFDEDQYTHQVAYTPGRYSLDRKSIGTRYVLIALRTFVNPADPKDLEAAHAVQDSVQVSQPGGPGRFEIPDWDPVTQKKIRDALIVLGDSLPDKNRMFGKKSEVDPVRRLIGVATAWGGNPEKDATYLNYTPAKNDGTTVHRLAVKDVPVDGFWSVTVYNAQGYFEKNPQNAYSFNDVTARKEADGSVNIQFGGCDGEVPNCLPVTQGWNYLVRLYRPRAEILSGEWKFPEATPVG
jgi:hypothetical protein